MSSKRRIEASRANGARSRGPVTPEGKQRSSQNAVRHGLFARCVLLKNEDPKAFEALTREFAARFGNLTALESGMVEELVACQWRIRRAWAAETQLLDAAVAAQPEGPEIGRIAAAFAALAAGPELPLLHRYETRLHRMFQRALKNILLLREIPLPDDPPDDEPDPAPAAEPTPDADPAPQQNQPLTAAPPAIHMPEKTNLIPKTDTAVRMDPHPGNFPIAPESNPL